MRATANDAGGHGDTIDDNAVPVAGMTDAPISLIERSKRVQDPDTSMWREMRYLECIVPPAWTLQNGDRIRDDRTGVVYPITSSTRVPRSLAGQSGLRLELALTT
jgi:hypothetical protein